jgi:hypothetical protein
MNYLDYKSRVIEQNKKDSENYFLRRRPDSFLTISEINVFIKYRQSKIQLTNAQISNLYVGLFVDGEGIINGTYIKSIDSNSIILSGFILKQGMTKLSFKCKLSSEQRWLDWNKNTWKNKIEDSSEKINFKSFKRPDNYYLRVKNYYDSRCKSKPYFVYKDSPVSPDKINCGDYINNLDPEDILYCDQYKNHVAPEGPLFCDFYQNYLKPDGTISCSQYQNHLKATDDLSCNSYKNSESFSSQKNCNEYHNSESILSQKDCS